MNLKTCCVRWLWLPLCLFAFPLHAAVVVLYHHVSDTTPASTSISPADFDQHLAYLDHEGYRVVPLETLATLLRDGKPLPDKTVAITFDDSYSSVYHGAFPKLRARGWPFTFFVNTDVIGTSSLFVSWDQLREMATAGATIANHTSTHHHMPRRQSGETEADFRARITNDIQQAQRRIEKEIGRAPNLLAYPYGEYSDSAKAVAEALGYIAFGQQSGPLHMNGDLREVPRFPFGGSYTALDDFALKVKTRPMPYTHVGWTHAGKLLKEPIVRAGDTPTLVLTLSDKDLASRVQCFATGQGAITMTYEKSSVFATAKQAFKPGRMRYNCTASAGGGRFYWYTQQWLVTDKQGQWQHHD